MPPAKQCRAMVAGQLDRGVYWSPPHRCLNYAVEHGYCHRHQPPARRDGQTITEDDADADS